jgi:hypothetical protein
MEVTLVSPINQAYKKLNLKLLKETGEKGYDIFNPEDDFFNDICIKYTDENNADVPIKARRHEYYQECALCESNCIYGGFNLKTMSVTCNCPYKSYNENSRSYSVINTESNFKNKGISNPNFKVMGCGGKIFKNLGENAGFWLLLIAFLIQLSLFIIFILFEKRIIGILLLDSFHLFLPSSPIENKNAQNEIVDDKNKGNNLHIISKDDSYKVKIYNQSHDKEHSNEFVLDDEKITHEGLNNMSYENAIHFDKRGYFSYFCNILMYNQMLLFIIFKDNWNFVVTKISMFVNIITFALLFNIMLFGNKLINSIYENKGKLTMNKAIGWIFLAAFLTVILNCIAKIFGLTKRDVDNSKKDPNFKKEDFYKLVFKRTIIYFIIILVLTLFIWFFGISFCAIYVKCQRNLVFYIFMTWLLIMIYPFPLCAIIALCRFLGLKYNSKPLFTISKGLQWIIML